MADNYNAILAEMVAVGRDAGALTLEHFKRFRDLEIGIKGPADFVSEADRQSEQLIRKYLFARYPDWSFTGEEFPPVDGADREHRWLVDPIDGTTNFINGQHYTISIALRRGNDTVCGALYNPVAGEMFTAIKGQGAFLNGERIEVSEKTDVGMMMLGTSLPTSSRFTHAGFYER
ncbi:MAG TPA: inositol monophosphatase family protein, partial [Devosia sp.]|nr:inositol monophosphatase family protein [Devosia sp.]